MSELDKALADIVDIRSRLAADTLFRGFGPLVIALTGGLAIGMAFLQSTWSQTFAGDNETYLLWWTATALVCAGMIGSEMISRTYREHGGLADAMLIGAIENFIPAGLSGAAIGVVILQFAPNASWLLPGLWQVLVALGLFSAARNLPRSIKLVAGWYLVSGICVLIIAAKYFAQPGDVLSTWLMGFPFAIGQLSMAVVLKLSTVEDSDAKA